MSPPPRESNTLKAAMHEVRCGECRVTWRSWWRRLNNDSRGFDPMGDVPLVKSLRTDVAILRAELRATGLADEQIDRILVVGHDIDFGA